MYLKRRTDLNIGAVMFSKKYGVIGKTTDTDKILGDIKWYIS